MKLLSILLFGVCMSVSASVLSQNARVTVDMRNVALTTVLEELGKQSKCDFFYNYALMQTKGTVSVKAENRELGKVLEELLSGLGLAFTFDRNVVVIREKVDDEKPKSVRVKGFVYDMGKHPMPGVTVKVVGIPLGTSTNAKGWFAIELPMKSGKLEFSFVGFKKKQVDFTEKTDTLKIVLEEEVSDLEEVTVVAYGERKKREMVGSISSVKADEMKELPAASIANLLQGRMAGVSVVNQSGSPGGGGTIVTVRGFNSLFDGSTGADNTTSNDGQPLYVIDGVPMHSFTSPVTGTNALAELDPSMIESVEVLKDAAAGAIYGSRASNGVVLITTKKGKIGRGQFSANFSYSASIMPLFPEQIGGRLERLYHIQSLKNKREPAYVIDWNTYQGEYRYPNSYNEVYEYAGGTYDAFWDPIKKLGVNRVLQDSLNPFYNNQTNWYEKMFQRGDVFNANLQASGGTQGIRYMFGAGLYRETGIMPGSVFKRANLLVNLSANPVKQLQIDERFYLAYADKSLNLRSGVFAGKANGIESMTVDPRRTSTLLPAGGVVEDNILEQLNGTVTRNDNYRLMSNTVLNYTFVKGLSLSASLGIDYSQANNNTFKPDYLSDRNETSSSGSISRNINISNEELLKYTFSVAEQHNFDFLLGFGYTKHEKHSMSGGGLRGPSNDVHYVVGGPTIFNYGTSESPQYASTRSFSSSFEERVLLSYFGRIAYNYKQRYLLEATYRRDGSSTFGEDVRWSNFPSIAVGWAFSEEPFLKKWTSSWLNFGKIRVSWGTSGQDFNDPYLAHGVLTLGNTWNEKTGMAPSGMLNRKLSWEESDQYDFGLDMDMFNYRLKFKLDYYYKYTKSLLQNVLLPSDYHGISSQMQNAIEISNEGLELEMQLDILRESSVSWRMRFNIARNWNRFEKSYTGMDMTDLVIGKPLHGLYLYNDQGVFQTESEIPVYYNEAGVPRNLTAGMVGTPYYPGLRKIVDVNGDGIINMDDTYYAGSTLPKADGGIVHELRWKNFDVNVLFNFSLGRKMINEKRITTLAPSAGGPVFADIRHISFWQKEGDITDQPRLGSDNGFNFIGNIRSNLERVNYMKLKQLTIGYNLPKKVAGKLHLSGARVFVTGENLFLLSNYSGLDPEIVSIYTGIDDGQAYPLPRKFTIGLTLNF